MTESGRPVPHPGHVAAAHRVSAGTSPADSRDPGRGPSAARELVDRARDALDVPLPAAAADDLSSADHSGTALEDLAEAAGRLERAHELLSEALSAVDKT